MLVATGYVSEVTAEERKRLWELVNLCHVFVIYIVWRSNASHIEVDIIRGAAFTFLKGQAHAPNVTMITLSSAGTKHPRPLGYGYFRPASETPSKIRVVIIRLKLDPRRCYEVCAPLQDSPTGKEIESCIPGYWSTYGEIRGTGSDFQYSRRALKNIFTSPKASRSQPLKPKI